MPVGDGIGVVEPYRLVIIEVDDDGNPASWRAHVTGEEYSAAPSIDN